MTWIKKKEKGFVLIMVLISISVLLLLGSSYLNHTLTEADIAKNHVKNTQAYYAAEAGIEMALAVLSKNFTFTDEGSALCEEIGRGYFEVSLEEIIEGRRLVTSRGYVDNAVEKIQVIVTTAESPERGIEVEKWLKPGF